MTNNDNKTDMLKGCVIALGNFDGVHLGHRAVLRAALDLAAHEGTEAAALTFDPHPQTYFHKDGKPFLLTLRGEKEHQMKEVGLHHLITLNFTEELASMEAKDFVEMILVERYAVRHVVVGYDFVFGKGRAGTTTLLKEVLEPKGISVIEVPAHKDETGEAISSTRIRAALKIGNVEKANALLGRKFVLRGMVEAGDQRGRKLDFPTANLRWDDDLLRPKHGVYAVWARRQGEDLWWPAVANFGVRPTFDTHEELFEFHILDFHGEFYGSEWEVALESFIRPEQRFNGPDALKKQITIDAAIARKRLKGAND